MLIVPNYSGWQFLLTLRLGEFGEVNYSANCYTHLEKKRAEIVVDYED